MRALTGTFPGCFVETLASQSSGGMGRTTFLFKKFENHCCDLRRLSATPDLKRRVT